MKVNFLKVTTTFSAFLVINLISGCLKDTQFENRVTGAVETSGQQNIIEIGVNVSSAQNALVESFPVSTIDTTLALIPVSLASTSPAAQDIHVTLKIDSNAVHRYNYSDTANNKAPLSYVLPDPSLYSIVNNVVTIPKGSYTGFLSVKLKTINYLSGTTAFGFSIVSVDPATGYTISGNLKTGVVVVSAKNSYDGVYSMRIKTVGWAAYGIADNITGTWPGGIGLVTSGPNTVTFFDYPLGGSALQPAFTTANAGATQFGAATPQFTFDPASNKLINVNNTTPDDGRGRAFLLNPAVTDSRFDPATKTVYAAYIMKQNGRPNQFIYDTLVYTGSR